MIVCCADNSRHEHVGSVKDMSLTSMLIGDWKPPEQSAEKVVGQFGSPIKK